MNGYGHLTVHRNWWITIDTICDIGQYYQYLYNLTNKARIRVQKPKWGYHITLIRSEEPLKNKDQWTKQNGKIFQFEYNPIIITGEKHIWLNITCKEGTKLRELFGLTKKPQYPLHLTIGYIEHIYNEKWFENQKLN